MHYQLGWTTKQPSVHLQGHTMSYAMTRFIFFFADTPPPNKNSLATGCTTLVSGSVVAFMWNDGQSVLFRHVANLFLTVIRNLDGMPYLKLTLESPLIRTSYSKVEGHIGNSSTFEQVCGNCSTGKGGPMKKYLVQQCSVR